jgi:hypothetical protein
MSPLPRFLVWLSRIHKCQGFGIQSPTDFDFVRSVVNEHDAYYAYDEIIEENWLQRKLGELYLRIANWRQPATIFTNDYQSWFQAGCRSARIETDLSPLSSHPSPLQIDLARIEIEQHAQLEQLYAHCNQQSVVIVEGIWRDWQTWHAIEHDARTGTTFDLYYCGIVLFDTQRYKHNYRINF